MNSPNKSTINWDNIGREAADILARYIRIDTTNPPGNEGGAAQFVSEILSTEAIESQIYESAPGRANVVARLKGSGEAPPLLLLHHMDVVPANADSWSVPPFNGVAKDGHVWGRGAIDDKGLGVVHLVALMLIKRMGLPLKRDVILMAVSDEEEGGTHGAKWMVDNHWDDIQCEYVWDEGAPGTEGIIGSRIIFSIAVQEKRSTLIHLTARGVGGHGSYADDTPLDRLVSALHALHKYRGKLKFDDLTRDFFSRISYAQGKLAGRLMRNAEKPIISKFISGQVSSIPAVNAMLRDTISATVVKTGDKTNVASEVVEAYLDTRLLPGTDADAFLYSLRRIVKDPSIEMEYVYDPVSPPASPIESELMSAFEKVLYAHVPDSDFTPVLFPAATDSRFFRDKGVKAYGMFPFVLTFEDIATVHGVDERLSVDNLTLGVKIALDVIAELCG